MTSPEAGGGGPFGDLRSKRLIAAKGFMFLVIAAGASALILIESPSLTTAALVGLLVWASARFYYFLFYALERYVDPSLRYAGLWAMLAALRRGEAARALLGRADRPDSDAGPGTRRGSN